MEEIQAEAAVRALLDLSDDVVSWTEVKRSVEGWREKLAGLEKWVGDREAEVSFIVRMDRAWLLS